MKKTRITEEFTFEDFRARYGDSCLVLFLIEESGNLTVVTADNPPAPQPGQTVITLVDPVTETA